MVKSTLAIISFVIIINACFANIPRRQKRDDDDNKADNKDVDYAAVRGGAEDLITKEECFQSLQDLASGKFDDSTPQQIEFVPETEIFDFGACYKNCLPCDGGLSSYYPDSSAAKDYWKKVTDAERKLAGCLAELKSKCSDTLLPPPPPSKNDVTYFDDLSWYDGKACGQDLYWKVTVNQSNTCFNQCSVAADAAAAPAAGGADSADRRRRRRQSITINNHRRQRRQSPEDNVPAFCADLFCNKEDIKACAKSSGLLELYKQQKDDEQKFFNDKFQSTCNCMKDKNTPFQNWADCNLIPTGSEPACLDFKKKLEEERKQWAKEMAENDSNAVVVDNQ